MIWFFIGLLVVWALLPLVDQSWWDDPESF